MDLDHLKFQKLVISHEFNHLPHYQQIKYLAGAIIVTNQELVNIRWRLKQLFYVGGIKIGTLASSWEAKLGPYNSKDPTSLHHHHFTRTHTHPFGQPENTEQTLNYFPSLPFWVCRLGQVPPSKFQIIPLEKGSSYMCVLPSIEVETRLIGLRGKDVG